MGASRSTRNDPKVHAFILAKTNVRKLAGLLEDEAIRSVNVADVAFHLGHAESE
jgi:hypothetical protein